MESGWKPELQGRSGPVYRQIAEALIDDIRSARLAPGTPLPPHRTLAFDLGVTVGTVTRAFGEVQRAGLIEADGRRGSRVRGAARTATADEQAPATLDLRGHLAPLADFGDRVRQALMDVALDPGLGAIIGYEAGPGRREHREAGAAWLGAMTGSEVDPERIVVCNGAQHALLCALMASCRAGDRVATERLTYAGLKSVAPALGLTLVPIDIDDNGLLPDSLQWACSNDTIKALVTVPDLHNPTTATQPLERRKRIADVARRHDLLIIEDVVYAGLTEETLPSIARLAEGPAIRFAGLSKTLGPGLRIGYLEAPADRIDVVAGILRATSWMASPIQAELASRLIRSGTAAEILRANKAELAVRNRLVADILADYEIRTAPGSPHAWLRLPDPWTREGFQTWAQRSGLLALTADSFAVSRDCPDHAVRFSIGTAASLEILEHHLRAVANALKSPQPLNETPA